MPRPLFPRPWAFAYLFMSLYVVVGQTHHITTTANTTGKTARQRKADEMEQKRGRDYKRKINKKQQQ